MTLSERKKKLQAELDDVTNQIRTEKERKDREEREEQQRIEMEKLEAQSKLFRDKKNKPLEVLSGKTIKSLAYDKKFNLILELESGAKYVIETDDPHASIEVSTAL